MDLKSLSKLVEINGTSGNEKNVAKYLESELKKYGEVSYDNLGSIICEIKSGNPGKKVAVVAHMDEVGLMVKQVTNDFLVSVTSIGGLDLRPLLNQRVSCNGLTGIITLVNKVEESNEITIKDIAVDFGFNNLKNANSKVKAGDQINFISELIELEDGRVVSKAMDNRVGCSIILEMAKKLKVMSGTVYLCATVQEEVGLRGAITLANKLGEDIDNYLIIDNSPANDIIDKDSVKLGEGTLIRVKDPRMIFNYDEVNLLREIAKDNSIKYQSFFSTGATDSVAIEISGIGNVVAALCVPGRNLHTHNVIIDKDDYDATLELASKYVINKLGEKWKN